MNRYLFWSYRWLQSEILAIPGRVIAMIFIIFLLILPLITTSSYILKVFINAAIFTIYASSWDVLAGFTGLINLGHALFFGVGAYSCALVNIHFSLPPWATIPLGGISAVIMGLIAGIPSIRIRGLYLSLVTLAFPIILTGIVFTFPDFSGGEMGLYGIAGLSRSRFLDYYIVLAAMICSLFIMYKFTDVESKMLRTGVILRAIREDEITARTSGINTTKYKLLSFVVSGFFAGIAGGLYTHFLKVASPLNLDLFFSFQPILWTIFGGIATIYGAVAGVYILYIIIEFANLHPVVEKVRFVLFALLLICTLLFMPEGLTVWVRDKIEIKCARCKLANIITRRYCRVCRAPLHLEKKVDVKGEF